MSAPRVLKKDRPSPPCTMCSKICEPLVSAYRWQLYRETGRAYCSPDCAAAYKSMSASILVAQTNRKHASARMKAKNPMRLEETRRKVSQTLKEIGHRPPVRGGNGCPPPIPQVVMFNMLKERGLSPKMEFVVKTKRKRSDGYPYHYKLDVSLPDIKLCMEMDGPSHCTTKRKAQDARKDEVLTGHGWTVLRFTNKQVMEHLEECSQVVMSTISRLKGTTTIL